MNKYLSIIMVAAFAAAISCSKQESPASQAVDNTVIRAEYAQPEETKTELNTDGSTYYWSAGDQICILSSKTNFQNQGTAESDTHRNRYTLIGGEGTASATFQFEYDALDGDTELDGNTKFAVYPWKYVTGSTRTGWINITIPQEQSGKIGDAVSNSVVNSAGVWTFYNVSSEVKLTVSAADHIRRIDAEFANPVAGRCISNGNQKKLQTGNGQTPDQNSVYVNSSSDLDGDIYFTIYPIDAGSVALKFTNDAGQVATVTGNPSNPFAAGHIKPFGTFTVANGKLNFQNP